MSWLKTVSPLASGALAAGQSRRPVSAISLGLRGSVISMMSTSVCACSSSSGATTNARPSCCQANTLWYWRTGTVLPSASVVSPKFCASATGAVGGAAGGELGQVGEVAELADVGDDAPGRVVDAQLADELHVVAGGGQMPTGAPVLIEVDRVGLARAVDHPIGLGIIRTLSGTWRGHRRVLRGQRECEQDSEQPWLPHPNLPEGGVGLGRRSGWVFARGIGRAERPVEVAGQTMPGLWNPTARRRPGQEGVVVRAGNDISS